MQQDYLDVPPTGKVYSIKIIILSAFFGGILPSGYMIYQNFLVFGLVRESKFTVLFTFLALLLISLTDEIPGLKNMPVIYFLLFFSIIAGVIGLIQKRKMREYVSSGGGFHSVGKALGIFLICIPILLAFVLSVNVLLAAI